ncbi:MAG: hypothetical protein FJY07_01300 [Bacteroidetes bacterium]|nr:hypothetical protein [Bacteroidota bacterium]
MKKLLIAGFLAALILCCCKKERNPLSTGTITGPDLRECVCCGGWYIQIGNNEYRFYDVSDGSNIDIQYESFPLKVELQWEKDPQACIGDEIIILFMKKI